MGVTHAVVKEAWEKVQAELERTIGEQNFHLYLKNTLIVQLNPDIAEIGVPNLTIADFVEDRFANDIMASIERVQGYRPATLKFSINGHLFRRLRERERANRDERPVDPAPEAPRTTPRREPIPRRRLNAQVFNLNPRYRLDNFVVGPSNKLAFNCAVEVATRPGRTYNPMFIYGGCGLGKTHLLQGIANALLQRHENLHTLYVSAEYFVNQYVQALTSNAIEQFRARFRNLDVLIVDDIHFLRGKEKSQEELLHTLAALETQGKQIVLASDLHPKELEEFKQSLQSRFVQGMVAQLNTPQFDTRLALIKSKLGPHRERFPDGVVSFLAEKLDCNIRELEGYLTQLSALAAMTGDKLSLPLVQQALTDFLAHRRRLVELSDIENVVIAHFGVTSEQLHGRVRKRNIAIARQVCMYLARQLTQHSLKEIGRFFGGKNHTTVVFAEQKITSAIEEDPELKATVNRLSRQLNAPETA